MVTQEDLEKVLRHIDSSNGAVDLGVYNFLVLAARSYHIHLKIHEGCSRISEGSFRDPSMKLLPYDTE